MDGELLTITRPLVDPRTSKVAWVAMATYFSGEGDEPRCIDYRVRAVLKDPSLSEMANLRDTIKAMREGAVVPDERADPALLPLSGIPTKTLDSATPTKLLQQAMEEDERRSVRLGAPRRPAFERVLLTRQGKAKRGRPRATSLRDDLRLLEDVEVGLKEGLTMKAIAERNHISISALDRKVAWARHQDPQLFSGGKKRVRGGRLTEAGRELLEMENRNGEA